MPAVIRNHRVSSAAGAAFFSLWIAQRFYFTYRPTVLWWLVTSQFVLFVLAYLTRHPAREHARGFWETAYPLICAVLPFALDDYPFKPRGLMIGPPMIIINLMVAGTLIISAGVIYLRRSFSIMTEIRPPVFRGIYRWCRHPMYLGSLLSSLGLLLYSFHGINLTIFVVFCIMQIYRARLEENKIVSLYPVYRDYAVRTGWVWRLGRRKHWS